MKRTIIAGALAAAILPLMAVSASAATTPVPPGPAIYPGNGGSLTQVTPLTPAEIYTPWGVITDEDGTGATIPTQFGGSQNGKPYAYPGWVANTPNSASHVQLSFAILTTPAGQQEVIQSFVNATGYWASAGGVEYPTCMTFAVAATGQFNWMAWSNGSWVKAPGCQIPG